MTDKYGMFEGHKYMPPGGEDELRKTRTKVPPSELGLNMKAGTLKLGKVGKAPNDLQLPLY